MIYPNEPIYSILDVVDISQSSYVMEQFLNTEQMKVCGYT